ncbi:hypothetical protein EDL99_06725 [Ornithobacterium rhinotracheale]|uniref:hypothetical protein n=1 Tax=Ornithobacterium rhinotracheale TaxID=28251 RepID=UPI00129D1537|nr:hypothetical protein [Ornithobacterium rhinotracheale]MRJ08560.1 hypothetical protein [Ornithobacterium rhinotracheale]UOH76832.1 hypothetical protein MT996_06285 [Ornithobacterium rhinotracheale]
MKTLIKCILALSFLLSFSCSKEDDDDIQEIQTFELGEISRCNVKDVKYKGEQLKEQRVFVFNNAQSLNQFFEFSCPIESIDFEKYDLIIVTNLFGREKEPRVFKSKNKQYIKLDVSDVPEIDPGFSGKFFTYSFLVKKGSLNNSPFELSFVHRKNEK